MYVCYNTVYEYTLQDLAIVPLPEVDGECGSSEEEGERGEGEMVFPLKLPGHTKKRTAAGIEELCH